MITIFYERLKRYSLWSSQEIKWFHWVYRSWKVNEEEDEIWRNGEWAVSPKLWTFGWLGSWAQFTNRLVIHQAFLFLQWYSLCQFTLYIYFYCDPIENEITIYYENEVVAERWSYKRELSFSRLIVVPLFFKYFVGVRKENERLTAIPSNSIYNSKSLKEDDKEETRDES